MLQNNPYSNAFPPRAWPPIFRDFMVELKRMTAIKTDVETLINGKYISSENLSGSFVLTKLGQKISRARVLAIVIDKFISADESYAALTLDDGTEKIRAKVFRDLGIIENVENGDIIDIIGKLRSYNEEIYIVPEIIQHIKDQRFITLRKLEIEKQKEELKRKYELVSEYQKKVSDLEELKNILYKKFGIKDDEIEAILLSKEIFNEKHAEEEMKNKKEEIIKLIERLDSGNGCEYSILLKESNISEDTFEKIINELLAEGICFEPKPGIIKLL